LVYAQIRSVISYTLKYNTFQDVIYSLNDGFVNPIYNEQQLNHAKMINFLFTSYHFLTKILTVLRFKLKYIQQLETKSDFFLP